MRYDGVQPTGQKFEYSGGLIKRPEDDEEIKAKSSNPIMKYVSQLPNILSGNMNVSPESTSASAFNN